MLKTVSVILWLGSTKCGRGTYTWPTIQERTLPKTSDKKLKREKAAYKTLITK
jgi:hypothetical protein